MLVFLDNRGTGNLICAMNNVTYLYCVHAGREETLLGRTGRHRRYK